MPTMATGMPASWMNSTMRSAMSSGSVSRPTIMPACTSRPWFCRTLTLSMSVVLALEVLLRTHELEALFAG